MGSPIQFGGIVTIPGGLYEEGNMTLDEIGRKHGVLKSSLERDHLEHYAPHLETIRSVATTVLEIGVGKGDSLRMWADYFLQATIHGIDAGVAAVDANDTAKALLADPVYGKRIKFYFGYQQDEDFLAHTAVKIARPIDLIVDDGSHKIEDQLASLKYLFPLLGQNRFYFIEGVEGHWQELTDAIVEMAKLNPQIVNLGTHQSDDGHTMNMIKRN